MSWYGLLRRRKADAELQEELDSFLSEEIDENLARGKSPEEARRLAGIKLGSRQSVRETVWQQNTFPAIESLWPDLKYAIRTLKRTPAFTAVAILVMALGIGSSVTIFAFVDAALIKPLPYKDPARLVSIYEVVPSCPLCNISYQNYQDWRNSNLPFSSLQAWGWTSYLIDTPQGTEPGRGARVSDGFFRTLGVTPILGRDFYSGEDKPGAPHTVLLRYGAWQKRFGGNRSVVGQTITLSNISYTIIGVLPEDFHFAPVGEADFWAALNDPNPCDKRRGCHGMFGLARLKDGVSLQTAIAGLKTEMSQLERQYADSNHGYSATATTLRDAVMGDIRPVLLVLLSGVFLLLLIACVNVSGLLLVRSESRKRETAVRAALGATSAAIVPSICDRSPGAGCDWECAWSRVRICGDETPGQTCAREKNGRNALPADGWTELAGTGICGDSLTARCRRVCGYARLEYGSWKPPWRPYRRRPRRRAKYVAEAGHQTHCAGVGHGGCIAGGCGPAGQKFLSAAPCRPRNAIRPSGHTGGGSAENVCGRRQANGLGAPDY